MPAPDFSEYDRKFEQWFTRVTELLKLDGPLDQSLALLDKFDPYGEFDCEVSPEDFVEFVHSHNS